MMVPEKFSFSQVYHPIEIWGALGLLDQGFSEELDIFQVCADAERSHGGRRAQDEGVKLEASEVGGTSD